MRDSVVALPFDPRSPDFAADPYPHYERLRAMGPFVYVQERTSWFATGHAVCATLLRDRRLGHESIPGNPMLFANPPDHTRLRLLLSKAFTPRRIELLRGRIQEVTDALIDSVIERGAADIVENLAVPLPITIIAELLGIPEEDRLRFGVWSRALADTFDPTHDARANAEALAARKSFNAYFDDLLEERRGRPGQDLLSGLIAAEQAGDRLTTVELQTTSIVLLIAGHITTVNLIANGVLVLLRHADQMRLLREDGQLIDTAVEEFLRYESPLQVVYRFVLEDFEFDDHSFAAGDVVTFLIGAANRDPAEFDRPNQLDIGRLENRHLAFGGGIHFCLGAPLSRLEGQVAIETVLRRMPKLELAIDEIEYPASYVLRGPMSLPVTF